MVCLVVSQGAHEATGSSALSAALRQSSAVSQLRRHPESSRATPLNVSKRGDENALLFRGAAAELRRRLSSYQVCVCSLLIAPGPVFISPPSPVTMSFPGQQRASGETLWVQQHFEVLLGWKKTSGAAAAAHCVCCAAGLLAPPCRSSAPPPSGGCTPASHPDAVTQFASGGATTHLCTCPEGSAVCQ